MTRQNGESFTLGEYGVDVTDVVISGIEMEEQTRDIQGLNGAFDMGATYKGREITVPFSFQGQNLASYPLFRDLIYKLTTSTESYYIQELRRPQIAGYTFKDVKNSNAVSQDQYGRDTVFDETQSENEVSTGKRYLVRLSGATEIEQSAHTSKGKGELTFHTTELPFAESIGTSTDLERDGLHYTENPIWSYGMGLNNDPATRQYTFDVSAGQSFEVFNFGDVPIDQFNQHLILRLKFNQDLDDTLKFGFNDTDIHLDGPKANISAGDIITYETGGYFNNGLSILNATNYKIPELQEGLNKLMFNGTYDLTIEVECRFYYL
ncbi:phage tail domain-containing protein [Staphylococcus sp. Mo2-1]